MNQMELELSRSRKQGPVRRITDMAMAMSDMGIRVQQGAGSGAAVAAHHYTPYFHIPEDGLPVRSGFYALRLQGPAKWSSQQGHVKEWPAPGHHVAWFDLNSGLFWLDEGMSVDPADAKYMESMSWFGLTEQAGRMRRTILQELKPGSSRRRILINQ